jgi:hypothetical protein
MVLSPVDTVKSGVAWASVAQCTVSARLRDSDLRFLGLRFQHGEASEET